MAKAKEELEQEVLEKEEQKARYLDEKAPPIHTNNMSLQEIKVLTVCSHHTFKHVF